MGRKSNSGGSGRVRAHNRTRTGTDGRQKVINVRDHDRQNSRKSAATASGVTPNLRGATFALAGIDDSVTGGDPQDNLRRRAAFLGVDLSGFESTTSDADDVAWSSNDWCFDRDGVIEAADIVVTRDGQRGPEVLCIRRSHPPFASTWALPGGLQDEGETLQIAADRELEEETGIKAGSLGKADWLGELHAVDWDPRSAGAHVGAAHYHTDGTVEAIAGDDAVDTRWVPVEDIASGKEILAFGHSHWVASAFRTDTHYAERLDVVSEAARYRNRRIIGEVNKNRREAQRTRPGLALIPEDTTQGSWGKSKIGTAYPKKDRSKVVQNDLGVA